MKVFIMRGSYPSAELNWFDWLKAELLSIGYEVILDDFPSDTWAEVTAIGEENIENFTPAQSITSWEVFFEKNILSNIQDESFIFVGHSIAPVFFLHMLEKHSLKVELGIFISPFLSLDFRKDQWQFYPVNKTFYKTDFNFSKINMSLKSSFVVYGDDDPYVPQEKILDFAVKTESNAIAVKNGKHLGDSFKKLPVVLELIKNKTYARTSRS